MKLAPRSFVARPLLLATLLVSTVALAATCPGMPPSQVQPACQAKAMQVGQQAYTYVYDYIMRECLPSGSSYCQAYATQHATSAANSAYASTYDQCMSSGGPC